jgi:predicted transcriptional regulator
MANIKTAVSLDEVLFRKADSLAEELNISRSRLFALALEQFLRENNKQKMQEKLNEVYADGLDLEDQMWLKGAKRLYRRVLEADEEW